MVSRIALVSCLVLCCLAVMAAAGPARHEQFRGRQRSAALKSRPAVATSIATARAQQEESDEPEDDEAAPTEPPQEAEEPQHDDEQEEEEIVTPAPVKPLKPTKRPRAKRPQRPATTTAAPESEEEDNDGGVTAVASSVSHGAGAVSHSRAAAYGGRYTNGRFGRRN